MLGIFDEYIYAFANEQCHSDDILGSAASICAFISFLLFS